ncbi:MAG: acyl carrier protein [Aequorivita sp.]|uniref:acyl carrier protein n=1 Tax=Aequorivita capsosiphonis TaxID=487317 RepID=UPI0003FEBF14|nr:acyl carrier protein [Aequorivita capsosiphonis]
MTENTIQQKILKALAPKLQELSVKQEEVNLEESLLSQGVMDSISFLEFLVELEDVFSIEFDFSELDPTEFTSVKGLIGLIQQETLNRSDE